MTDPARLILAHAQGAVQDAGRLLKRVPDAAGWVEKLRQLDKEIRARLEGMPVQEGLQLQAPPERLKPLPVSPPDGYAEIVDLWLGYKRGRGEKYQEVGLKQLYKLLVSLGPERAMAAVEFSIACRYQGIIEQKNGNGNGKPPDPRRTAGAHASPQTITNYSRYDPAKP